MKYLITERQHKLLLEDKDIIFQELLNNAWTSIKKNCENGDFDSYSEKTCDELDVVNKIELVGHYFWGKDGNPSALELHIDVYYANYRYMTFEHMIWDIATEVMKWVALPVRIKIEREINTNNSFDW